MVNDWEEFLRCQPSCEDIKTLQRHERTGRPLGDESFITNLVKSIGRYLKHKKPGRKLKQIIWCPQISNITLLIIEFSRLKMKLAKDEN